MSYGMLLIRIVLGLIFAGHGAQKLFGWFGGGGPKGTGAFFGSLRFRAPLMMGIAAGLCELGGGALVGLGFVTPLGCLAIAVVMVNAIGTIHWPNGFWNGNGGYEFNLLIISVAVGIAAIGPGRFSIDHAAGWDDNLSGLWWGVGALGASLVISFLILTLGRRRQQLPAEAAA